MPRVQRSADVVWEGDVPSGSGTISGESGALMELGFTLPSRIGAPQGKTSPEELIAAAQAACFAMSLSNELSEAGANPERVEVRSTATLDEVEGAHRITMVEVRVRARVPGLDDGPFQQAVRDADESCPVSNVLRAAAEIRVQAELER
jgi:lipoyl-dependent peroxiredoxin